MLLRMIESGKFSSKRILLVDKAPKQHHDRTWCFWEKEKGFFEEIVYKQWSTIFFRGIEFSKKSDTAPYQYKMIRSADFYEHCFSIISRQPNVTVQYGIVEKIENTVDGVLIWLNGVIIKAAYIFNSILFHQPVLKSNEHYMLQHFRGWVIEAPGATIDVSVATLMDFSVDQQYGTAFVYVMPFSKTKALVEYTFFSEALLKDEIYEEGLKDYLRYFLKEEKYAITEKESGVIPMTNYFFRPVNGNIINIGTAGGQTRGSSGYTFQFIQKRTKHIVEHMLREGDPFTKKGLPAKRFLFYDSVLLHLLNKKKLGGDIIFTKLFQKNATPAIFKFLDAETSVMEDIAIIKSLPAFPFSKAALKQILG